MTLSKLTSLYCICQTCNDDNKDKLWHHVGEKIITKNLAYIPWKLIDPWLIMYIFHLFTFPCLDMICYMGDDEYLMTVSKV